MELALILAIGGDESAEFRRQSADLDAAWSERGAPVRVITRPGLNHFTILADFADRESPLTRAVLGQMRWDWVEGGVVDGPVSEGPNSQWTARPVGPSAAEDGKSMIARDPTEIKEHHEVLWNAIVERIESLTAAGETDIARIIPLVAADERREMGELDEEIAKFFSIPRDENGVPRRTLVAVDGKYQFVPPNFVEETMLATVLANLTDEADLVVELGSGWGRNLFNVYLRCRRKDLRFVACEPADAGRRATELLCALEDGIPFTVHPFTYMEPDLSFLEGRPNVLFFTNHSIEQVTRLDPRLFDLMLERTARCTCVHAEPIGWQRHKALADEADKIMRTGNLPVDKLTFENEDFAKNAALYSWKRAYNIDLLSIINRYQRAGKINIKWLEYDFWGANPFIPATLVVWEKSG